MQGFFHLIFYTGFLYRNHHSLIAQIAFLEYLFCFLEQHFLVVIPGTVMPQEQLPYPSIPRHRRRLTGGTVVVDFGTVFLIRSVGTLVIKQGNALHLLSEIRDIAGITHVGIAAGLVGRSN